jgi:hypothetical protein
VYATIRRPSARRERSAFHAREKKKAQGRSVVVRNTTNSASVSIVVVGALSTRFSPRGVSSRAFAVDA